MYLIFSFWTLIHTFFIASAQILSKSVHKIVEMWITHVVFPHFSPKSALCINMNSCGYL